MESLIAEIQNDPLARGYSAMTDQDLADSLNTANRDRNKNSLTGDEVFQATDPTEYSSLANGSGNTEDLKGRWVAFCARAQIDPFANSNVQFVIQVFGGGSTTVTNLSALRVEQISRGVEIGFGFVHVRDVSRARLVIAGG